MIVCSILANEGLPDIPAVHGLRSGDCTRPGRLVIADEAQAGSRRTGHWWGYEVTGFTPDIAVTGKPTGAGSPLAATCREPRAGRDLPLEDALLQHLRFHPAAGRGRYGLLDEIEQRDLLGNVATVGTALKAALTQRKGASDAIGDVRGHGLFIGVELVRPEDNAPTRTSPNGDQPAEGPGFLTSNAGAFANVVKIRPPLPFSQANAAAFLVAWDETIAELAA